MLVFALQLRAIPLLQRVSPAHLAVESNTTPAQEIPHVAGDFMALFKDLGTFDDLYCDFGRAGEHG